MKSQLDYLQVSHIQVAEGRRPINEAAVQALMDSIGEMGMKTPITVRIVEEMEIDGESYTDVPVLVAGAHRLEAARRLGWHYIDCFVQDDEDPVKAEMWEIAENLHRAGLTQADRDQQIRRYAELLEAKRAEKLQSGQTDPVEGGQDGVSRQTDAKPNLGGRPTGVAKQIADETGLSQRTVQRALSPPKPKPASPPAHVDQGSTSPETGDYETWAEGMKAAWNEAPPEAQQWFRDQIATHGINHDCDLPQPDSAGVSQPFRIVLGFAHFCSANDPDKYAKHIPADEREDVGELYASLKDWLEAFIDALDAEADAEAAE